MGSYPPRLFLHFVRRAPCSPNLHILFLLLLANSFVDAHVLVHRRTTQGLQRGDASEDVLERRDSVDRVEEGEGKQSKEEVEQLKKTILQGLGLSKMPDVSKMNVSQEEYARMYQVYLRTVEENAKKYEPHKEHRVQRFISLAHQPQTGGERKRRGAAHISWLAFPMDLPESRQQHITVDSATLRLFITAGSSHVDNLVHVRVYQVLPPSPEYPGEEERLLVDQRAVPISPTTSKWVEFDVTRAVQAWSFGGNETNFGLELDCRDCHRNGVTLITHEAAGINSSISPVLNLLAGVHVGSREKRSLNDPLEPQGRNEACHKDGQKCCRHVMKVKFKELEGFGFILQPTEFDAGYCKGKCPPRYNPAHHHATLQSLIRKQQGKSEPRIPRVCCAPSLLKGLEVLHIDEEDPTKLKMTLWDQMQVLECACS